MLSSRMETGKCGMETGKYGMETEKCGMEMGSMEWRLEMTGTVT